MFEASRKTLTHSCFHFTIFLKNNDCEAVLTGTRSMYFGPKCILHSLLCKYGIYVKGQHNKGTCYSDGKV